MIVSVSLVVVVVVVTRQSCHELTVNDANQGGASLQVLHLVVQNQQGLGNELESRDNPF